jgi:hypothetical protein
MKNKLLKYSSRMSWAFFFDEKIEARNPEEAKEIVSKRYLEIERKINSYKNFGLKLMRLYREDDDKMSFQVNEVREVCPECDCSCQKKKNCLMCGGLGFIYQDGSLEKLEHEKLVVEWDNNLAKAKEQDKLKREKKQFLQKNLEMLNFSGKGNSSKDHRYKCSNCNHLYTDCNNPFTKSGGGRFIDGKFICFHCKKWEEQK